MTVDVSALLRPRPRPTTLKVPGVVAENVPLSLMVPPVALQASVVVRSRPRWISPRKRIF